MPVIANSIPRVLRNFLRRLGRDRRGVALVEFAYLLPLFLMMGFAGVELANLAMAHLRVNQIAISLADNISRAKQSSVSGSPRLREYDIQDAFIAAMNQGADLSLEERGRLIVSSLEVNAEGGQWVHWQRCAGEKDYDPQFGEQGDGITGTSLAGMGPPGRQVVADHDSAIMFVEVAYDYQPLISTFLPNELQITKTAAMYVRDDRDLSQIYNPSPAATVASC